MLCASHLFLMHCMLLLLGQEPLGLCRTELSRCCMKREPKRSAPIVVSTICNFYLSTLTVCCSRAVILKGRIKKLATKMVITSGNEEDKGSQEKESKEETILAMLGIIGTILNLIVIIFVYIYTTL
ncbi:uncharacterized protein LOC104640386 isoform X1 [Balearica regulorum gibbericeps]|uniref:uncharacterized protein LOC104640386 isoform X1 n=1 Tax=Balearica regulorum gibbericeps TaxID=100784 RepID=UPI003F648F4D